jgi:DNA-binding response OmpR family regulator
MDNGLQPVPSNPSPTIGLVSMAGRAAGPDIRAAFLSIGLDLQALEVVDLDRSEPPAPAVALVYVPQDAGERTLRSVVEWARRAPHRVGLIGVVPRGALEDSERVLGAGFDDSVVADVSARELACRARALLRRVVGVPGGARDRLVWGRYFLDTSRYILEIGERRVQLTPRELRLLRILIEAGGKTFSRDQLLDLVWGSSDLDVETRAVDSLISRLRHKLGDDDLVVTVHGVGFRVGDRGDGNGPAP